MRTLLFAFCLGSLFVGVAQADSLNVRLIGSCDTPGSADNVAVDSEHACVADWGSGLRVISVADPAHPVEIGYYDTPGCAISVAVSGEYAYVADEGGLRVISVSDPAHPVEVGYYDTPGWAWEVTLDGEYAYVADRDTGGLRVISVSDPAHPAEVGYYDTPGEAFGVALLGDHVCVADGYAGLQICKFYGGGVEEGRQPTASSFRPAATIVRGVLHLPGDRRPGTEDRAELLDASGRRVMELHQGANDVSGLVPGVYFVGGPMTDDGRLVAIRKVAVAR
jgi:hypothetical protein